jgi:uncharacterized membrane protein YqiK
MTAHPLPLILGAIVVVAILGAAVIAFGISRGYKVTAEPKAAAAPKQAKAETGGGS